LKQIYEDFRDNLGEHFNTHDLCAVLKHKNIHLANQYKSINIPPAVYLGRTDAGEDVIVGNLLWNLTEHMFKKKCSTFIRKMNTEWATVRFLLN
jgi:hypothetical protein